MKVLIDSRHEAAQNTKLAPLTAEITIELGNTQHSGRGSTRQAGVRITAVRIIGNDIATEDLRRIAWGALLNAALYGAGDQTA